MSKSRDMLKDARRTLSRTRSCSVGYRPKPDYFLQDNEELNPNNTAQLTAIGERFGDLSQKLKSVKSKLVVSQIKKQERITRYLTSKIM